MNDAEPSALKIAELLRHPDDLDKISALKGEFTRKKTAVDGQLKQGLKEQLQLTQAGMGAIHDGQRITNLIKEEMMKIDKLCAEAQRMIRNFPEVNAVARVHRNFVQVEAMKRDIETFNDRVDRVEAWLREDAEEMERQPNLLRIHDALTTLRNIRDDAKEQFKKADDRSLEEALNGHFERLDDAVAEFDEHIGRVVENLIPILYDGGDKSLIVRVVTIIEAEERYDERVRELQEAQKDFSGMASRFESLRTGPREVRGYKDNFLQTIRSVAEAKINGKTDAEFRDDADRLDKSTRWFFNDLNTVKVGMTELMPRRWRILDTYVRIYHDVMRAWLAAKAADQTITPTHMLAIIHWKDKYHAKMARLGVPPAVLEPPLPGGRDSDLVREYRQLIVGKVEQWMGQMDKTDRHALLTRSEATLEHDAQGHFRTKTLGDMWHMLREQLIVASQADLSDVTEGVTDAMFRALKARCDMWAALVAAEYDKYARSTAPQAELEGVQGFQDWLVALANDQIACVEDGEGADAAPASPNTARAPAPKLGYLSSFRRDYESLVSRDYATATVPRFEALKDSLANLALDCIRTFARLIVAVDFRATMPEFFTPAWYSRRAMGQIISTYDDYLGDYAATLPDSLHDILIEELANQLLVAYLSAVRNRGARFRRQDPFDERIRDDVLAVFGFFQKFPASAEAVRERWRVVEAFNALIAVDKQDIVAEFGAFLAGYWDLRLSWVEAVLRARDDIDWSPIGDGKALMKAIRAKAAAERVEGLEATVMGEVE